eukprot:c18384_g4_i1 orf=560-796(+)
MLHHSNFKMQTELRQSRLSRHVRRPTFQASHFLIFYKLRVMQPTMEDNEKKASSPSLPLPCHSTQYNQTDSPCKCDAL